ncbi:transporter substrate-binding domain-containing protein [Alteromonas sp. ASW11-36]|uniref:Transporter substrate-binding domain-containing protein n=1 Tax=Alteromonas arenosi TaxID=3055817 RepID=A0ABT7T078_9ALTE|nr:transporter substrate-binding domain-containing protein [Alteromonas sp. ASW11-36]MDM7861851.1 transporter substrate-binding domain-containing protein [Alteromonas sp. ASW11-36]
MKARFTRLLLLVTSLSLHAYATAQGATESANFEQHITVYVDDFTPYINGEGEPIGKAAKLLLTVAEYSDLKLNFKYVPYADATALLTLNKRAISYPFFKTPERLETFLFSKPIAKISSHVFYNRQSQNLAERKDLTGLRVGIVDGYSYGSLIDSQIETLKIDDKETGVNSSLSVFSSDREAIAALIRQEIDALPMADDVMNTNIANHFKPQRELIKKIDAIRSIEALYVIAPKSAYGEQVIAQLDAAISAKFSEQVNGETNIVFVADQQPITDVAELVPAEGFPAITGTDTDSEDVYTLPIGTRVAVLDWSEAIREPNNATQINRNMLLTSRVVVLNGPHVGKELLVKNMHIHLQAE